MKRMVIRSHFFPCLTAVSRRISKASIVNWAGHKYGYENFDNGDRSRNTLPFDVVTMGELFQNNHHRYPMSPDFAARWFEIDPAWQLMRLLAWAGVISIATPQKAVYPAPAPVAA